MRHTDLDYGGHINSAAERLIRRLRSNASGRDLDAEIAYAAVINSRWLLPAGPIGRPGGNNGGSPRNTETTKRP